MKGTRYVLGGLLPAVLLFVGLTACELEKSVPQYSDVTGYVVDLETGAGEQGTSVTLTRVDVPSIVYTTETNTLTSSGQYNFFDIPVGRYELTAVPDADVTDRAYLKQVIELASNEEWVDNIGGYDYSAGELKIIAMWDGDFADVDAYLTLPNGDKVTGDNDIDSDTFGVETYYDFYSTDVSNISTGFFPENSETFRSGGVTGGGEHRIACYHDQASVGDGVDTLVTLDVDDDGTGREPDEGGGPETITINYGIYIDNTTTSYTSVGLGDPSKLPAGDYTWTGVYEYYLVAWTNTAGSTTEDPDANLSSTDNRNAAFPTVFVVYEDEQLGTYSLPNYTDIHRASILRINCFREAGDLNGAEYFQILPDIQVVPYVQSVAGEVEASVNTNFGVVTDQVGPIVVGGRRRDR